MNTVKLIIISQTAWKQRGKESGRGNENYIFTAKSVNWFNCGIYTFVKRLELV